jgi:hypothetical protein
MKKNLLGFVALLIVVMTACAQQKKSTAKKSATGANVANTLSYVGMERTACFGRCPAYLVELFPDGKVRYTSHSFTEYEGIYEKNMGSAKTQEIIAEFKKLRVDTCKEDYDALIQDLPGLVYHFKFGSKEKKVYNANFGPTYFKTMADKIDQFGLPDKTWKKVGEVKTN